MHYYDINLSFCSRSKDVIEPLLKPQWYANCKDMAEKAVNVSIQRDQL